MPKTIESNIIKLESIRALGEKVTASYSAEMPGAHNASSKVENAAVSLADVSKTIKDETDELAKKVGADQPACRAERRRLSHYGGHEKTLSLLSVMGEDSGRNALWLEADI